MNRIIGKSEMAENSELDTVNILDILDPASGIYTHGGSLTELSLMLTAFEKQGAENKIDADTGKDAITNFIKNVVTLTNGKSEMQITGPPLERTKLLEVFGNEKPVEVILSAQKKDETGEEEGDALVDKLIDLLFKTPTLKLYQEFGGQIGIDSSKLKTHMTNLLKTVLKDSDLNTHIVIKSTGGLTFENVTACVEINKPFNRNVWEYDEAFISENGLSIETEEDKNQAVKVYENKKGNKAYKLKETDGNIKLMAKDEKDV